MNPKLAARFSCAMLIPALAIAGLLMAIPIARAADDPAMRAASDKIVAAAEALIKQAGQADPIDSKLVRDAINRLQAAVRVDPRNDAAYVDLGFCYSLLRDGSQAIDMYTTATQINPSGANFLELADIYLRAGDAEGALMAANAGIVKDPQNARLYNAKGGALNDLQRIDEAEEAYEKAIKLDPSFTIARENLKALNSGSTGRGSISRQSASH
ncbi:MAG TPA: tetratricopeptide repeat protein [Candidatus Binataceae bacterium]|nr:tetratricopeptide repeat protein [Candidatus Binataceae bacterium]